MTWQAEFRNVVERKVGIFLRPDQPLGSIEEFVSARTRALSLSDPTSYLARLGRDEGELSHLIKVLTNGETCFLRNPEQMKCVQELVRARTVESGRSVSLWSAGCSTGEEAYTLAMLCDDAGIRTRVLATDINQDSLGHAEQALYSAWSLRRLPPNMVARFFRSEGDRFRLVEGIRRRVEFRWHNLNDASSRPEGSGNGWDVISCQNVLIYFRRTVAARVLGGLAKALAHDGWLFLSAVESIYDCDVPLVPAKVGGQACYRRAPAATAPPHPAERPFAPTPPSEVAALSAAPSSSEPAAAHGWLMLGNLRLSEHDFEGAHAAYGRAHVLDPFSPEVHYLVGVLQRKVGDLTEAEAALRRALFLQPSFWPASFLLAGVYARRGKEPEWRREISRTLKTLEAPSGTPVAYAGNIPGIDLSPEEVVEICRREIAR